MTQEPFEPEEELEEIAQLHAEIVALQAHVDQLAAALRDEATPVHRKQAIMGELRSLFEYVKELADDFGYGRPDD